MKLLVIDNYDSFTYNLVQLFGEMDVDLTVKRNDEISIDEIKKLKPDRICISPGPGRPDSWCLSWSSMHRASVRRRSGARRKINARQDFTDSSSTPRRF